jgi:hypothetical protein
MILTRIFAYELPFQLPRLYQSDAFDPTAISNLVIPAKAQGFTSFGLARAPPSRSSFLVLSFCTLTDFSRYKGYGLDQQ